MQAKPIKAVVRRTKVKPETPRQANLGKQYQDIAT